MKKVLLFGATGHLGKEIAAALKNAGYDLTVAVRSKEKAGQFASITSNYRIIGSGGSASLQSVCKDMDVIVSALGKSVSLNDKTRKSFFEIDLGVNSMILEDAKRSGVKKFVYVSALDAEKYLHLEYFKAHHDFAEKLMKSGIDYSIVKPPAIFSAFIDLIGMAKKGQLMTIGKGDKKTNPIYEGDLAKICVQAIEQKNSVIETGGPEIKTRQEINQLIQQIAAPGKKVRSVPPFLLNLSLPLIKIFNPANHAKYAFFSEVVQHDTIGPAIGKMKLEEYIRMKNQA